MPQQSWLNVNLLLRLDRLDNRRLVVVSLVHSVINLFKIMSLDLIFSSCMRVGGESIKGEVELRFPQVVQDEIEEVHVRLKGLILTRVSRQYGTQQFIRQERTEICKESQTVWTKGTIYPSPGSQILRVPFQFNLPVELHPSFEYNAAYKNAIIGYFIEVVGARKGTFNANRRIIRPFAVVRDDPEGASIRSALQKGWSQEWTTTERFAKIRKGLWGGHADVRMEFLLPKVAGLPLFTKIPFKLRVVTTTKEMKYTTRDESDAERVFPVPPILPKEVELSLRRQVYITARRWAATDSETVAPVGSMGKSASSETRDEVVKTYEKRWVPCDKDNQTGSWRQQSEMQSTIELKWSPSFSTPNLTQRHFLRLKVCFPGIGNNLQADIPIRITSGMVTPTEAEAPAYDGPPPALNLPPTYWDATDWDQQQHHQYDEKANADGPPGSDGNS
ncbi:hypothetical protein NLI96_g2951 [Meripilus lineatus]|uniref:Arrestin-like N-terminal domain-containing protein n=1 Tax=Meripilus lineatus TaxID=2056292 RepID=A0AAD5V7R7_9APHY|nr:hypothetical protein NLI96_g2951 [Physisporinus lineatus]